MNYNTPFAGSYQEGDCIFLLKRVQIETCDVAEKERAIQSGARHYSEMLSVEKTPGEKYLRLFYRGLEQNQVKLGRHIASLAKTLAQRDGKEVVVVSLARAGTPIGVLVKRGIEHLGKSATHYCVSIIRDRGIDWVALDYIRERHADKDIVFIDGWTGKGAITTELNSSVAAYNESRGAAVNSMLAVVADLAGVAGMAASNDDYLIPSAVLNAIVSGLISRTVLSEQYVGEGDFHACMYYEEKAGEDLSRYFVDTLTPFVIAALPDAPLCVVDAEHCQTLQRKSAEFIAFAMEHYGITHRNHIKPGIGESTRVLLRRVPERLVLRDTEAEDVQHLITLAKAQGVLVEHNPSLPYRAAAFIAIVD